MFLLGTYGALEQEELELMPFLSYLMNFCDFHPDTTGVLNIIFPRDAPLLSRTRNNNADDDKIVAEVPLMNAAEIEEANEAFDEEL